MPGASEGVEEVHGLLDALARDHHVIGIALPGSGRSGPIPRAYGPRLYEEDARLMAEVLGQRGITSAIIAGFSDGGEVALVMAARHPNVVRAVVAWGAVGVVPRSAAETLADVGRLIDHPREGWSEWRTSLIARYGGTENARAMTAGWSAAVLALLDAGGDISLSLAPMIQCPVLLIAGSEDRFAPAEDIRRLASRIRSATVHIVPGVGHGVHRGRGDWFESTVRSWLEALNVPQGDPPAAA